MDCKDGSVIIGETNSTFTTTNQGQYAVIVTQNGCTDTSECVALGNVSNSENHQDVSSIILYPNPGNGIYTLKGVDKNQQLRVLNAVGQTIAYFISEDNKTIIDLSQHAPGIYILEGEGFIKKIVQQ